MHLICILSNRLTKELREGLAKIVKDIGESSKLSVRRARTKGMKKNMLVCRSDFFLLRGTTTLIEKRRDKNRARLISVWLV